MKNHVKLLFGLSAVLVAGSSQAAEFSWTWVPGSGGGVNNAAGVLNSITSTYNNVTNRLSFYANFGSVPGSSTLKTDGFHLVLSDGPNPKGHAGELAIFYFDASGSGTPKLTAYNYNGFNGNSSYYDGSPAGGIQTPDRIKSSLLSTDWIMDLTERTESNGTRTLGFTIDATDINNHDPLYDGPTPWKGAQYGEKLGIWFHSYAGLKTEYKNGFLKDLDRKKEGWLDAENMQTVPEPTTLVSSAILLVGFLGRRRMKKQA